MQLQVPRLASLSAPAGNHFASTVAQPVVARASLGIADMLAVFIVAMVVFGPKRLPVVGRQIGKIMFDFRRTSNDFKLQFEEELRLMRIRQQDHYKMLDLQATANKSAVAPIETLEPNHASKPIPTDTAAHNG